MDNSIVISELPTLKYKEEKLYVGLLENVKVYNEKIVDERRYLFLSAYSGKINKTKSYSYETVEPNVELDSNLFYSLSGAFEKQHNSYYDYNDKYKIIKVEKCKFISAKTILNGDKYDFTVFEFEIMEDSEEFKTKKILEDILGQFNKTEEELKKRIENIERTCDSIYNYLGCIGRNNDCGYY